jgi:hypothetical protein
MKTPALFLTIFVLTVGCGPAEPPVKPTWVDDVEPILRGNCFHCHGAGEATAGREGGGPPAGALRWDVFERADYHGLGEGISGLSDGKALAARLGSGPWNLKEGPMRMPPPPALPLSDYERQVLENWIKLKDAAERGKRVGNNRPRARLVSKRADGDDLVITFEVIDADGEQVLGKLVAGDLEIPIPRSGRHSGVRLAGVSSDTPVEVLLSDGWHMVTATLK